MDKQTLQRLLWGEFTFKRLIRSLIFIYTFFCLYVFFFADGKIFLPQPSSYADTRDILKVTTHDQIQLSAVYLPNPASQYTIVYIHGNAEDLGDIQPVLQSLQKIGFSVFAYDYRGYGTSQGKPSERHAYQDIEVVYNYLVRQLGVPPRRIIAFGRSVGGGSAVDLAARQPLAGLILESSFISAFRVILPFPILPFDKFPNLDKIKKVKCPVLIMHGKADEVIPFQHGQKLFAAAHEPKLSFWVDEASHNDLMWVAGEQYAANLRKFAQLVGQSHPQP
ncbi:alpha/beta hydrolase [Allocoleopsis franciscana]|uniref:Alpha/beta superfamily hydrolase n=1 Tax=Allocoleopsis franciscana PCC 7113 TaxID=1173027 RepID=K9WC76_9CYAN|nr:alpha/beta hydrolase [Allocoleopsis franciscana]AFZ17843.1 alpha/beta superfamily hydrolase [Allocoleopsis franciscana PCC 7113]